MSRNKFLATHGLWDKYKSEYQCWQDMLQRCNNPRNAAYKYYGGRGIYVCERWLSSFEAFMEDMGPRPNVMSLDRINNDGPYSPDNCRWSTINQQNRNHRGCVFIEYLGVKKTIVEWSEKTGINKKTLHARYANGWPIQEIFRQEMTRPSRARKDSQSGLLGVSKYRNKWKAQITIKTKVEYLGLYETAQLAHEAYMTARAELRTKNETS
jgi:hypothetical protein